MFGLSERGTVCAGIEVLGGDERRRKEDEASVQMAPDPALPSCLPILKPTRGLERLLRSEVITLTCGGLFPILRPAVAMETDNKWKGH